MDKMAFQLLQICYLFFMSIKDLMSSGLEKAEYTDSVNIWLQLLSEYTDLLFTCAEVFTQNLAGTSFFLL